MSQNLSPAAVVIGALRAKKKKILCSYNFVFGRKTIVMLSFLVIHSKNCLLWPTKGGGGLGMLCIVIL